MLESIEKIAGLKLVENNMHIPLWQRLKGKKEEREKKIGREKPAQKFEVEIVKRAGNRESVYVDSGSEDDAPILVNKGG